MSPFTGPAFARWRLPAPCGVCGTWSQPAGLCADCLRRFAAATTRCTRCALRVPPEVSLCGDCIRELPLFERTVAAFDYAFPWDHAIAAFKFRGELQWSAPLARALAHAAQGHGQAVDYVTAVPLADSRLRTRGYNQAWEIARRCAATLGLPARHDLLHRLRDTPQQMQLKRDQRDANLRGAFMPGDANARRAVQGRCVALVDDVMTTGTTANEASRALLEAGARSVHLWVLARTERDTAPADATIA
ncbi:phosphoribosyltransferase family protein [Ideonella sp.]|uniref:ComF family protein n=1 Tax=Ideonella sp. TaxID=1929293 RepID=UPI0035B3A4D9